jgi:hypothetical protein
VSPPGISKIQWQKDAPGLFIAFCAIAFLPLSIVLLRPRPFAAESVAELISIAREQTVEESVRHLSKHKNAWTLQSPESRWEEIKQAMQESDSDVSLQEASAVIDAAKPILAKRSWPLYAKRAWLQGEPVWLVASGDDPGEGNFFCGMTTREEKHDWKVEVTKNLMSIVVVTATAPHQVLTH